ncbi:twin-arginine translocase subunit TatC [Dietzia sp.]|uniref:twin-arginine translocase subunit TatC n=1 Tax=Dietzia sp. TaxID=1871616 RepID=UPI002FD8E36C
MSDTGVMPVGPANGATGPVPQGAPGQQQGQQHQAPHGGSTGEKNEKKRRRKKKPADGAMPIMEHVYEFRRRLLIAVGALVLGSILGFAWYQYSVGPIGSLGHILTGPYCSLPESARANFDNSGECRLLATGPFEQFMLRLKVSITAGAVLSCPVWLYQIWAFIVPGLHKKERAYGRVFTILAALLFVIGAVTAYIVVAHALSFLLSVGNDVQVTALSGSEYFNFVIYLLLIFGVSFEIPLLIAMLNVVGILRYEHLKKSRRGIIVAIFALAAVISPGSDPFSMLALAVAVCFLVEVATQFARINDKRRGRKAAEWENLDDTEASSIDSATAIGPSSALGGTTGIGSSGPVSGSPTPGGTSISVASDHMGTSGLGQAQAPSQYPNQYPGQQTGQGLGVGGSAPLPPPSAGGSPQGGGGSLPPSNYDDVL